MNLDTLIIELFTDCEVSVRVKKLSFQIRKFGIESLSTTDKLPLQLSYVLLSQSAGLMDNMDNRGKDRDMDTRKYRYSGNAGDDKRRQNKPAFDRPSSSVPTYTSVIWNLS